MRCRECGTELDARDRLRNGAYRCPECGAIHHTAQSSRVSPSPYRRKRRSGFAPAGGTFAQRYFGLPLWSWLAIALAVIVAIVLLVIFLPRGSSDMPVPEDVPIVDMTASPVTTDEAPAGTVSTPEPTADAGAAASATHNTGIAQSDFLVSFDWAMSYLNYTAALTEGPTETGANGESLVNYTYQDWFTMQLALDPTTKVIRSATGTAQVDESNEESSLRARSALVSMMYGFDITMSGRAALTEVESMISGMTESFEKNSFSATIAKGGASYTMNIVGKLQ